MVINMKFKTKTELEKHREENANNRDASCFSEAYSNGLDDAFKSFKERIEFYKKYDDVPFQLKEDNYNLWLEFGNSGMMFVDWLFDYCFKDV